MANFFELYDINNDVYAPTGDPKVGYPQLCIRTNRTAQRSDLEAVVKIADDAANQFPPEDKEGRKKAVFEVLTQAFGGGGFGHSWIIFFHSNKKGDCTTYGFHEGFGFVKNSTASNQNDSPERKFHLQRCVPLTDPNKQPDMLEKTVIHELIQNSLTIAELMGMEVDTPENGAYTPISNCSWFAGQVWNYATDENLVFEQQFDGKAHADDWGMDFLANVTSIADPGMVAESLAAPKIAGNRA